MKKSIACLSLMLLALFAKVACAMLPPEPPSCEEQMAKLKGAPLARLAQAMASSGTNMPFQRCLGDEMLARGDSAIPALRKILNIKNGSVSVNARESVIETLGNFGGRAQSAIPELIGVSRSGYCFQCAAAFRKIGISGALNVSAALNEVLRNGGGILAELIYKDAPGFSESISERLGAKMFQVQCHDTNNPYMGLLAHTKKLQAAEYLVRYLSECANSKPENYAYFKPMCTSCSDAVSTLGNISFPLLVKRVNDPNGSYGLPARLDARTGEVDQRLRRIDQRLLAAVVLSKVGGPAEQRVIDDFARKVAPSLLDRMKSPSCRERDEASFRLAALAKLVGAKYGLSAKYPRLDCRKAN